MKPRSQREPRPAARELDHRVNNALTDLSAYALTLDNECHRLEARVLQLAQQESSASERRALVLQRAELAEELNAFREVISALHEQFPQRRP
jgi:ABC-type phosphate transport system auxiliary subunit